jgi:hypothetical protein
MCKAVVSKHGVCCIWLDHQQEKVVTGMYDGNSKR